MTDLGTIGPSPAHHASHWVSLPASPSPVPQVWRRHPQVEAGEGAREKETSGTWDTERGATVLQLTCCSAGGV